MTLKQTDAKVDRLTTMFEQFLASQAPAPVATPAAKKSSKKTVAAAKHVQFTKELRAQARHDAGITAGGKYAKQVGKMAKELTKDAHAAYVTAAIALGVNPEHHRLTV